MILEMFITLMAIAAFFMWYGFYTKIRVFSIVGLVIIFLLGSWIILYSSSHMDNLGLQYQSGSTVSYNGSMDVISYNYVTWNDATTFWVGLLLSVVSVICIFLVGAYQE